MTSMYAYELLPRLKYLTLSGQDEDGELEWIGTDLNIRKVKLAEDKHEKYED